MYFELMIKGCDLTHDLRWWHGAPVWRHMHVPRRQDCGKARYSKVLLLRTLIQRRPFLRKPAADRAAPLLHHGDDLFYVYVLAQPTSTDIHHTRDSRTVCWWSRSWE